MRFLLHFDMIRFTWQDEAEDEEIKNATLAKAMDMRCEQIDQVKTMVRVLRWLAYSQGVIGVLNSVAKWFMPNVQK